jgi:signal transduction histidine kinase
VIPGLIAGLAISSLVVALAPDLRFAFVAPALDIAMNASTTLVAIGVSGLAWARFRETGLPAHFYEAAAFVVLSASGLTFLAILVAGADAAIGMSLADPGQAPLYMRASARLVAGVLLLLATSRAALGADAGPRRALTVLLLGGYALGVLGAMLLQDRLPQLIDSTGLARIRADPEVPSQLPGITLLGAAVHLAGSSLFFGAAWRTVHHAGGRTVHRPPYFAAGLVLAAFGELHAAVYPGTYTSLVTTADMLRLAFYAVLLVGINADVRADLRALRDANAELSRLHEAELARTALEERAYLAREIHDGVAQELWLARLKAGHLAAEAHLSHEGRASLAELTEAIDAGLADTGHAVIALRARADRAGILPVLEEYAAEFTDRFGIPVRVEASEPLPPLDPRPEAESLRIVQEALNNVRKHADATLVRVVLERDGSDLAVAVIDNGRGFAPDAASGGFGIQSMSERAGRIGARVAVHSAPSEGTTVRLILPSPGGEPT